MQKVAFVQRMLPHYRVDFVNGLHRNLAEDNIQLTAYADYVTPNFSEGIDEIDCAHRVKNLVLWNRKHNPKRTRAIYWQPIFSRLWSYDLVIVEQSNGALINYPLLLGHRYFGQGPRTGYWGHGMNLQRLASGGLKQRLRKSMTAIVDHWFAYTSFSLQFLSAAGVEKDAITIVNNSQDTGVTRSSMTVSDAERQAIRDRLGIDSGPIALFCTRLLPTKGVPFVVDACRAVRQSIPNLNLVVIGDGALGPWLREQAAQETWIRPLGAMYGPEKADVFSVADVFLIPSALGLSILDAFGAGLAPIAAQFNNHGPEVAYLENGVNGLMTEPTEADYAAAVVQVLTDADLRQRLSAGARAAADTYTVENMVSNFADGVRKALSN